MENRNFLTNKIFEIISQTASENGVRAFAIGGFVRDCFLGRPCKDIDVVVEGSGIEIAEKVAAKVGSKLSVFKNFGTAKFQYRCREFWCRGYYVDTTGKNTQVIKEYIQNQLKIDKENMQLAIDYPEDPFKGSK